jgi:penicillin-binding protein 1C
VKARVLGWGRRLAAAALALFIGLALWRSGLSAPEPTYLLVDRLGVPLGEAGPDGDAAGYWPMAPPPPRVVAATIALEDRRFRWHSGVDPVSIVRAVVQNLRSGERVSGASTIAMQLARLQHPGRRTYLRKAHEALTAIFLTVRHGRDGVLAQYLRLVPYGNRIHGIGYAARRYLDKPVEDLSWAETAFLAAIPQAPGLMNPQSIPGRERAVRRAERILAVLSEDGTITASEHSTALRELSMLRRPLTVERPREAMHVLLKLERDLRASGRPPGVVRTTLDLELQQKATWIAREALAQWEREGARNMGILVVDRRAHAVRAWVGSADWFDSRRAGAIDYVNVARSPGSALKPFIYARALDQGVITPATILDDLDRGPGGITNADERFLGPMLPRSALGNSRNVPAALLVSRLGVDETWDMYRDLGLHQGTDTARRYGLGLAIGGLPVDLEQLVRAYTTLSSDGRLEDLRFYEGQEVGPGRRIFSEDSARSVVQFLSDPQARLPSFARLGPLEMPFAVAVKTGTSSRYRDAWAAAITPRYIVGVWVGDPDFQPMNRMTGYRAAAEVARRVMRVLHKEELDGLQASAFPPPRGFVPVRLCALTGRLATEACDHATLEWMRQGEEPVDACTAHVRLAIDSRSGTLATTRTPRRYVELRTFVDLPPVYASWAASEGLPRPPLGAHGALVDARPPRLSITSPVSGQRVLRDPETPLEQSTIALRAVVDPPVRQVVWYVDGKPWETADYPYTARWPLTPGEHAIEVRLPSVVGRSGTVHVRVE